VPKSSTKQIKDYISFAEIALGADLTRHQRRLLQAVMRSRRVGMCSCHATGKSFCLACLAVSHVSLYEDARVLIITPGWLMNRAVVWAEIHALIANAKERLPIVSQTTTELRFGPKNMIIGLSASDAGRLQGHHSEHLLVIVDEGAALDPTFWPAIEGVLASGNSRLIVCGNPTVSAGPFADIFGRHRSSWETFAIGYADTENFEGVTLEQLLKMDDAELDANPRPYLITRRWVRERYAEWFNGSPENSPLWQSRVLGQFPSSSSNALIPLASLELARRKAVDPGGPITIGCDPAGPGRDMTAVVACAGGAILELATFSDADARGRVVEFIKRWRDRVRLVRVDSGGIGFYFAEHLRGQGFKTIGLNAASAATDRERYTNLKAERYFHLRQAFLKGAVSGLDDDTLGELASISYLVDPHGKICIEDKASVKSTLGHSPDKSEALMLALGEPEMAPWTYTPVLPRRDGETRNVGGRQSQREIDAAEDRANDRRSMLVKSRRWPGRGGW